MDGALSAARRNITTRGTRDIDWSNEHVEHGDPLVTAGAAQPMTVDGAFTAILGPRTDRCVSFADRAEPVAGMVVVLSLSRAHCGKLKAALPTALDLSDDVGGIVLSHGELPFVKGGSTNRSLSHRRAKPKPTVVLRWGLNKQIASYFAFPASSALVACRRTHHLRWIEFRPDDLASPRALRRTDDFLPNLDQ